MMTQVQNYYSLPNSRETLKEVNDFNQLKYLELNLDARLWDAFRSGDEHAFCSIYKDYVKVLFNYGKKFTHDRKLIKDCVQDFFLYLKDKRVSLDATASIKIYLLRSFRRRLLSSVIEKGNTLLQTSEFNFSIELTDCGQNLIENGACSYTLQELNKSFAKLSSGQREAIYFYCYEGIGSHEIAEIMGFSHVSSARKLINAALGNLADLLETPV